MGMCQVAIRGVGVRDACVVAMGVRVLRDDVIIQAAIEAHSEM